MHVSFSFTDVLPNQHLVNHFETFAKVQESDVGNYKFGDDEKVGCHNEQISQDWFTVDRIYAR
jgi:hypothetical protein